MLELSKCQKFASIPDVSRFQYIIVYTVVYVKGYDAYMILGVL